VLVPGGIGGETRRVLANLEAVVREAGATKADIVKTTIFLIDLGAFTIVNTIYAEFFGDHRPARATVQVSALPRQARIEIEAIAVVR
jgi:2-iminobutanoate/2-iminopropanoate deaminase